MNDQVVLVTHWKDEESDMVYPYLDDLLPCKWALYSERLPKGEHTADESQEYAQAYSFSSPNAEDSFRWVKDNKVLTVVTPDLTPGDFLHYTGLDIDLERGPMVASKRISRIMRPYRYYRFHDPQDVSFRSSPELDADLWDGAGLVRRSYLHELAEHLELSERHERELLHTERWEVTLMHDGGQEKCHAIVVDDLHVDFLFPEDTKTSVKQVSDLVFVGLQPVHGSADMRLDLQSLVNLYPFFNQENLMQWMQEESAHFLHSIESGELDLLIGRLTRFLDEDELAELAGWQVGEFLASGGRTMWFPHTIRALGIQHLWRLDHAVNDDEYHDRDATYRFPIPGGRYYIMPAAVSGPDVPRGHIEIDPARETAWVNDEDWLEFIVEVLGGCDSDDALWIFPFTDRLDGERKILAWRSPNQLGEYVVLRPTENSAPIRWYTVDGDVTYPEMRFGSDMLPTRIDQVDHLYGELRDFPTSDDFEYTLENMNRGIAHAMMNGPTLGAYCNALMVLRAAERDLPHALPARLEDVIDSSVKQPKMLRPVMAWIQQTAQRLAEQGVPVPDVLEDRIILKDAPNVMSLRITNRHYLSVLVERTRDHIAQYEQDLDELCDRATPPSEMFLSGWEHREAGRRLRKAYGRAAADERTSIEDLAAHTLNALSDIASDAGVTQSHVLLGAAVEVYLHDGNEHIIWQPDVAPLMLEALRDTGIIGTPIWSLNRATLKWRTLISQATAVATTINGAWFNALHNTMEDAPVAMGDVEPTVRDAAKATIATVALQMGGITIQFRREQGRLLAYRHGGNLIGYIPQRDEAMIDESRLWTIVKADAKDGNLQAVLMAEDHKRAG